MRSAVISSVKADLLHATIESRRARGEVKVFDPRRILGDTTATWSPLGTSTTLQGALAQTRIGAVFAVLGHQLVTEAFERANRTGEPFDPRVLVLLYEAANTPLPRLPQWAATVAGPGIQLVSVWQAKSQIDAIYGRDADAVLTNHRAKLIYPSGMSDMATMHYVADQHIRADLASSPDVDGPTATTQLQLIPPSALRRARTGDAVLVHGQLPPAWVRAAG